MCFFFIVLIQEDICINLVWALPMWIKVQISVLVFRCIDHNSEPVDGLTVLKRERSHFIRAIPTLTTRCRLLVNHWCWNNKQIATYIILHLMAQSLYKKRNLFLVQQTYSRRRHDFCDHWSQGRQMKPACCTAVSTYTTWAREEIEHRETFILMIIVCSELNWVVSW